MSDFGSEEGVVCGRNGCHGVISDRPVDGCSCHISPPCSACTTPREWCAECGWSAEEEERAFYFNNFRCVAATAKDAKLQMHGEKPLEKWGRRPLDPTKIDYLIKSHSNSSQICEGVCPLDTPKSEVEQRVKGTFGGRFEQWGGGTFKYIAYTD